jgi:AraC-like DNA-binding protein
MAGREEAADAAAAETGSAPERGTVAGFHFSTDDYRAHERISAWCDIFGRTVLNIDVFPESRDDFQASATIARAGAFGFLRAATSPAIQANSARLITNDDVSFGSVISGSWGANQLGRVAELGGGDAVLMSNGAVGSLSFPESCRYTAFSLPRSAFAPLVPDVDALFARRIPASNPALRLLMRYLDLGHEEQVGADPELGGAFVDHVCDLLALALGATRDGAELARGRGLSAARLQALKDDVRRSARNPAATIHAVAARHGVSPRYVQRVFEESGTTFTQYLAEQRLLAAWKALRRREAAAMPISTIAYDCGFSDVSHFNRLFRRRFGCTPGEARAASRQV